MTEAEYKAYFENLARVSKDLSHRPEDDKHSFFYILNPFDLNAIDQALRNLLKCPAMLLDVPEIRPDNNGSTNYTMEFEGQFSIVARGGKDEFESIRRECFGIGMKVLGRMHMDSRKMAIIPGKNVFFRINDDKCNVQCTPIGPMAVDFYGYMFSFKFTAPFGFSVSTNDWSDVG